MDMLGALKDKQCHVVSNGQAFVGKVVVWRCPCQLTTDCEIWEPVPLPSNKLVPDNCVIVCKVGYSVSKMADGDHDGDLVMKTLVVVGCCCCCCYCCCCYCYCCCCCCCCW
ncbi:unnamed protein product [Polarella glacialis]|uniref:Uncharacterized protein n=1 Tax=Polarella glacialis TaxID=89957 RepID=A0A813FD97_POLGL|nr:unnamed protein product [Polarella glacialis]